jgi:hypothetical protein
VFEQDKYVLFCDNQSAIHLSKNASFHSRSKHIEVHYHWIQNVLNSKQLQLEKVHTDNNGADMLTKVVTRAKLDVCHRLAGMTAGRRVCWAMSLHMEVCWQPNINPRSPTCINH